ncbi:MAG: hypothetical protein QOI59_6333 [Gammaproteobacteria bacterium]|nr:hypothetical protein [Gammaproteobacteria bacterium]
MSRSSVCGWLAAATLVCSTVGAAPTDSQIRSVSLDNGGVVRWRDSGAEVALYGANYCIMSGSDYRMSGRVARDREAMIDEDLAHFARMGWQALRLCSWGDWENSDPAGNLIVNEHVQLLDYVVTAARKRGIYMLLTPIHTYDPAFADQIGKPSTNAGFSKQFPRPQMGTNPTSIAAQVNYITQLLRHVNPYTGVALKDEPAIPFIEMINEPVHHPDDMRGSVDYINTLVGAVRASGSKQITFFNVSQDFAIAPAIEGSQVQGVSFGWYPTSLVAGHTLHGNYLQAVDGYPDMLRPELARRPRIVYEFDQADLLSGYLYPAMARTFRSVGTQFATMFAYDMLRTAPYNLGWQTHYLNLVHTPRKAVSAIIAGEAMRRLPRRQSYGAYPDDLRFGDFRVSYEDDSSELNATDAFMNAGPTTSSPREPGSLRRVVGMGSSGVVDYEGTGVYFLDKVRDGVWRLEVYPDQVMVRDPFEQPRPDKVVSRLLYRTWPMTVHLPDLGTRFFVAPIAGAASHQADNGSFSVEPGVWLLTKSSHIDRATLPAQINRVGFDEYHVNEKTDYPDLLLSLTPKEFLAGAPADIRVRVANTSLPDEVKLWVRPAGARTFGAPVAMNRSQGNDYHTNVPSLPAGLYEFAVSSRTGDRVSTFPGGVPQQPNEWPFQTDTLWTFRISPPGTPLRLFNPREDYSQLSFVRPGEQYRSPFFQIAPGETSDESALYLTLPDLGSDTPERYAAALYIGDAIAARTADAAHADFLEVKVKALGGGHKTLGLALIEKDGTAWSAPVPAGADWSTVKVPLGALRISRSIHIPSPYPGLWNYWRAPAVGRGVGGDHVRIEDVERIQLTVYPNSGEHAGDDGKGVGVESIGLRFGG